MIVNYTARDATAIAAIIPVFAIFLFAPGYIFGWASDLFQFRGRSVSEKILLSVPLSVGISTVLSNLAGRYISPELILWIFIISAVAVAVRLLYDLLQHIKERRRVLHRSTKLVVVLTILWSLGMAACLIDIQFSGKLNVNAAMFDHAVRVAFIHSALRAGPPPRNPFSYLGYAPVARYYYYWYVLCSYPARLTHINARIVLYGSSVWIGFSLAALIPLYLKNFFETTVGLRRKTVVGILLLSVTGLDILPTFYEFVRAHILSPDMEGWDPSQVTSWQDAIIWVPHHVASLVACLIGFLALWSVRSSAPKNDPSRKARTAAVIFAAIAFSAAAGLSVYVTFAFALFMVCWGFRLLWKRAFAELALYLWTACLSLALSFPYLHDLLRPVVATGSSQGGGGASKAAIGFGLRALPSFLSTPYFLKTRGFSHPEILAPFGILAGYILEFGFFAIVAWVRLRRDLWKWRRLGEAEIAAWYMFAVSMFVITFLRSQVIANNDLAFRSAMIAQFILLLWGADYLDRWTTSVRGNRFRWMCARNIFVVVTLLLGFIGTIYGVTMLRVYTILDDDGLIAQPAPWLPAPSRVGTGLLEIRQAYERLDRSLPFASITQYNPMTPDYLPLLEYDRFQSVDAFPDCGTEFGGDSSKCPPVQKTIADLFNRPGYYDIREICGKLSIDVLVARETDPAWQDRSSWVWKGRPIVENSYIRAFRCR